MKVLLLALLALYSSVLVLKMEDVKALDTLETFVWESGDFRAMRLGRAVAEAPFLDYEELAMAMIRSDFDLEGKAFPKERLLFPVCRQREFERLAGMYRAVFEDISCFPVPKSRRAATPAVTYEDGWMEKRDFDGPRSHEGCDLMGGEREPGFYPVVSMTGGVVEQVGWLKKGGWRIGIRGPSGAYFYYAHLDSYSGGPNGDGWKAGDPVRAGELLGYMGDSGYGEPGTTGQFPVHLHLGIYLKTEHFAELSVNPYWILRYAERFCTRASY